MPSQTLTGHVMPSAKPGRDEAATPPTLYRPPLPASGQMKCNFPQNPFSRGAFSCCCQICLTRSREIWTSVTEGILQRPVHRPDTVGVDCRDTCKKVARHLETRYKHRALSLAPRAGWDAKPRRVWTAGRWVSIRQWVDHGWPFPTDPEFSRSPLDPVGSGADTTRVR